MTPLESCSATCASNRHAYGSSYQSFPERDELAQRQGKDLKKLEAVIVLLANGSELPPRLKDHALSGDWSLYRDCHIEPDWLLIYKLAGDTLHLVRTGTHSDLFNR